MEALKARDEDNITLRQQIADCQFTQQHRAAEAQTRLAAVTTEKNAEIGAHRQEKVNVQYLAECQSAMDNMKAHGQTRIAFHTAQKNFALEKAQKETAMSEQKNSALQVELNSLQTRHDSAQKMMKQE